jgi:hypothetical protein
MKLHISASIFLVFLACFFASCNAKKPTDSHRIIVSTDIGGTDYDDYQSLVHLFVYSDMFDLEGLISSPFGDGRVKHIYEAIDAYEKDFPNLITYSERYQTADSLRKIVKQGAFDTPGPIGYSTPTEGSEWIVKCARKDDARPLNILIWGGIEDLAQALHDAPDILPKLRVFFIGGPNKKWSVDAYQYIADNFPNLWIIESNATYRGWFMGGSQSGNLSNKAFVETQVKVHGAMGEYFYNHGPKLKMGDTPSLTYFFGKNYEDPTKPGWGGQYVRAWERPHKAFNRTTNETDSIEQFGVLELLLPCKLDTVTNPYATIHIDKDYQAQVMNDTIRFLFSPKNPAKFDYTITSNIPGINELKGCIVSYFTPSSSKNTPSGSYPNWWTDDPSPEYIEDGQIGVKTLNGYREEFLTDFSVRMKRCSIKKQ